MVMTRSQAEEYGDGEDCLEEQNIHSPAWWNQSGSASSSSLRSPGGEALWLEVFAEWRKNVLLG